MQGAQQGITRFHLRRIVQDAQTRSFHLQIGMGRKLEVPKTQAIDICKHVRCSAQPARPQQLIISHQARWRRLRGFTQTLVGVTMAAADEKTNHRRVLLDKDAMNALKTTSMKSTNKRIRLNWDKLLGFKQVKVTQGELRSTAAKAMIGRIKTAGLKYVA